MLRGIYAPTDFPSIDYDPSVPVATKLADIQAAPVCVTDSDFTENFGGPFTLALPYGVVATFDLCTHEGGLPFERPYLNGERIDIGDENLYGYGIGTRLIQSAIRYGFLHEPRLHMFRTGWARLGMLNTMVRILGEDNVAVERHDLRYGWGGDRSLETIFDDEPPISGQPYLIPVIEAAINTEKAMRWELPVERRT